LLCWLLANSWLLFLLAPAAACALKAHPSASHGTAALPTRSARRCLLLLLCPLPPLVTLLPLLRLLLFELSLCCQEAGVAQHPLPFSGVGVPGLDGTARPAALPAPLLVPGLRLQL